MLNIARILFLLFSLPLGNTIDPPTHVRTMNVKSTSFTLWWKSPKNSIGIISKYVVQILTNEFLPIVKRIDEKEKLFCKFTGLKPSTLYGCSVQACLNTGSCSFHSETVYVRTAHPDVLPPKEIQVVEILLDFVRFQWELQREADLNITYYKTSLFANNTLLDTCQYTVRTNDAKGECEFWDLLEGTWYRITVQGCLNDLDCGDESEPKMVRTLGMKKNSLDYVPDYSISDDEALPSTQNSLDLVSDDSISDDEALPSNESIYNEGSTNTVKGMMPFVTDEAIFSEESNITVEGMVIRASATSGKPNWVKWICIGFAIAAVIVTTGIVSKLAYNKLISLREFQKTLGSS